MVFSATEGFRHESIEAGIELITTLGAEHDFTVEASEDVTIFNDAALADFAAVVFLQATGELLSAEQRTAFESYIEAGGGYVGVHCASCMDGGDWPFYDELVGAVFSGHPAIQEVMVRVENHDHPSTAGLPDEWPRTEEPYNFEMNPRGAVTVLATLDESTYTGGSMGDDHPIMWYHDFQGGRAWYTALGHMNEAYSEELFISALLGGIEYAAGRKR